MRLYFKHFFTLFLFLTSSLYAITTVDVTHIQEPQPLRGPWAFTASIVQKSNDPILTKQSLLLPQFLDEKLAHPHDIVTLMLALKTTPNFPLSINMKQPYSVWKLYANGKLIGSSGVFHPENGQHMAHAYYPIIHFTPTKENTHLLLYLANAQHQHVGFYGVPLIAPKGVLEKHHIQASIIEKIVIAILGLFGMYHIGLFLIGRKDKAPLWFGMVCISLAIRTATTGEKVVLSLFPNLTWEMLTRIEYVSGYLALPFFVLYVSSLYQKQTSQRISYVYLLLGFLFAFFAMFFSSQFFTTSLTYYYIIVVTFIMYTLWILFRSLISKESGSILAFITFMFFSVTIIHDLLLFQNIIFLLPIDLMPYGFLIYLFAQAAILLLRYANAFKIIEQHTDELEVLVLERTKELTALVSQRELLLRELTHRVKNNLQFIISLLWIQRKEADDKTRITLKTLESQIQSIAAVHESLCSKNTIAAIEIHDYIRKLILSLQQLHREVEIILDSREAIYIKTDHTVSLGLIINELVTNHMKYSNPTAITPIHISIHQSVDFKTVLHYNDGIDHREIFANIKTSSFGLPKLGWPMIKEFVKQMDGEIIPYHDHLELHFSACEYI
jgi:two-component sensor histidine kinase